MRREKKLIALLLCSIFSLIATAQIPVVENPKNNVPDFGAYNTLLESRYALFTHNRTYILPVSYIVNPDRDIYKDFGSVTDPNNKNPIYDNVEAEFQISFFVPVYRGLFGSKTDLMLAYTHHAWWQLYNAARSRPFRETNYMPELFARTLEPAQLRIFSFRLVAIDYGYVHESNGQINILSRSWDRLFARSYFVSGTNAFSLSLWWRIPDPPNDDDNPQILKYMGIGRVEYRKQFAKSTLEAKMAIAEKPGVELVASYPWRDHFRWYVNAHFGYGQSMIEYDHSVQRFGVGIALEDIADQLR